MESIEACWTVRIGPSDEGGVVVLESGRLYGGDSRFAYLGTYSLAGEQVAGDLRIVRHNPAAGSIFGDDEDEFELTYSAKRVDDDSFHGALKRSDSPAVPLRLKRLAELP